MLRLAHSNSDDQTRSECQGGGEPNCRFYAESIGGDSSRESSDSVTEIPPEAVNANGTGGDTPDEPRLQLQLAVSGRPSLFQRPGEQRRSRKPQNTLESAIAAIPNAWTHMPEAISHLRPVRSDSAKGMRITHVIDTHVHADHVSGGRALAERTGGAYALHESAAVAFPFFHLRDGQEISVGNVTAKVLHTPGHTPESICLVVTDRTRGLEPWFLLTGDTLFVGSVGRPDLSEQAEQSAKDLTEACSARSFLCQTISKCIQGTSQDPFAARE